LTNTTKALLITLINAGLALAIGFGLPVTDAQTGLILGFVNAALGLFVALTYKSSPKRIPDA